jgi:hypothetical protein
MRRIGPRGTQSRAGGHPELAGRCDDGRGQCLGPMRVVSSVSDPNDGALVDTERVQMAPYAQVTASGLDPSRLRIAESTWTTSPVLV